LATSTATIHQHAEAVGMKTSGMYIK